jgi:hypothetical protein
LVFGHWDLFVIWFLDIGILSYCRSPLIARQLPDLFNNNITRLGLGDTGAGHHGVYRLQPAVTVQVREGEITDVAADFFAGPDFLHIYFIPSQGDHPPAGVLSKAFNEPPGRIAVVDGDDFDVSIAIKIGNDKTLGQIGLVFGPGIGGGCGFEKQRVAAKGFLAGPLGAAGRFVNAQFVSSGIGDGPCFARR